jgi:hypothetical protein
MFASFGSRSPIDLVLPCFKVTPNQISHLSVAIPCNKDHNLAFAH